MKISTKGRYGLRALVDLASRTREGTVSLVNIAKRQKLSLNYLEQVFSTLRKAGIVKSIKGAQGGYMLAKEAEAIKVSDVLTALEGEFNIIDQVGDSEQRDPIQEAIQELVWDRINTAVRKYLDEVTLADLVERYQYLYSGEEMYYI